MPAPLIHIRGAEALQREGRLASPFQQAVNDYPWAYRLGALLVDLPLFDRFPLKVCLFLVRRPYPTSRWATVLHRRGSTSLAAALLQQATGVHRPEMLALVAGLLTHLALDRTMHPAVEEAVDRQVTPRETPDQLHEALENYQSLVWHRTYLGTDGVGTGLVRSSLAVGPELTGAPPRWTYEAMAAALSRVYGMAPTVGEARRWGAGLIGYRALMASPLAKVSVAASERLARERPWVARVAWQDPYHEALDLAASYIETAAAAGEGARDCLVAALGDGPLV
jgi:hypothetical protein